MMPVPPLDAPLSTAAVDVVLATHRRPHTIGYSIRSALAQTHQNFVLHVVGDGCDAETEKTVRSFTDPRIRFQLFPKAMGFGYAHRNTVLKASKAPYIAYLTDDDLWFPDHLALGLSRLETGPLDLVAFRSAHVQFPDALDPYFFAYDWHAKGDSWLRNWFTGAVGCIHRRSLFDLIGYWDDTLFRFGDRDFYNRARTSTARTAFVDHITLLRFFAQHWDPRYAELAEPPQAVWLPRVLDVEWRAMVRHATHAQARSFDVRRRQVSDFLAFGARSGPRFVRFMFQKLKGTSPARPS